MKQIIVLLLLLLINCASARATSITPQPLISIDAVQIERIQLIYNEVGSITSVLIRVLLFKSGTQVVQQAIEVPITAFSDATITNLNTFAATLLTKYLAAKGITP